MESLSLHPINKKMNRDFSVFEFGHDYIVEWNKRRNSLHTYTMKYFQKKSIPVFSCCLYCSYNLQIQTVHGRQLYTNANIVLSVLTKNIRLACVSSPSIFNKTYEPNKTSKPSHRHRMFDEYCIQFDTVIDDHDPEIVPNNTHTHICESATLSKKYSANGSTWNQPQISTIKKSIIIITSLFITHFFIYDTSIIIMNEWFFTWTQWAKTIRREDKKKLRTHRKRTLVDAYRNHSINNNSDHQLLIGSNNSTHFKTNTHKKWEISVFISCAWWINFMLLQFSIASDCCWSQHI